MGCDIHVYVEYNDGKYWKSLTKNAGSRNYLMFGIMAGVRFDEEKLFDPKGLPEGDLAYETTADYWLTVAPVDHPEYAEWDGYTTRDRAERWIAGGYSKAKYRDGVLSQVSDPDSHSHSWMNADELAQVLEHYQKVVKKHWVGEGDNAPTEWVMILAAMRAAETNGAKARVVFWFDN